MFYTSTRNNKLRFTFEEAVCSGYAPDGGLYVPESLPAIDLETLNEWKKLSYTELSAKILRKFISSEELSNEKLSELCKGATFGFSDPEHAVPVKPIGSSSSSSSCSFYISELFQGPTQCFKDLGMRFLIQTLSYFCTKKQQAMKLLVSTSGDTGPAALAAVCDAGNPLLKIIINYPNGQISPFQRRQLTTVCSDNQHKIIAFNGGGDDMDIPIKNLLKNQPNGHRLCGVNSYNIARPLMQMVHFIWTYLRVMEQLNKKAGEFEMDYVIPTGAMGNIIAAYMSKLMGLPIGFLCASVNINDITHRVIDTGKFYKSKAMERNLSEAINIQVPYNFERLLYYLTNCNSEYVAQSYKNMEQSQKLDLTEEWHEKLQRGFRSARIEDSEMCQALRDVYNNHNYLLDPHSAVAFAGAQKLGYNISDESTSGKRIAVFATASPCKFEEVVRVAIGKENEDAVWNKYIYSSNYPETARSILSAEEIPPTIFEWPEGLSFKQVNDIWEQKLLTLIESM